MEVATEVALRRRQNVWLEGRLTDEALRTPEQRERFQQLKQRFSNELEDREIMRDIEDAGTRSDADNYLQWLQQHDEKMCQARYEVFQARRIRRLEARLSERAAEQHGSHTMSIRAVYSCVTCSAFHGL